MDHDSRAFDIGCATNAVLVSLLRTLMEKKIISAAEVRALLTKAAAEIRPHQYTAPATGATGVILDELLPNFPEDGGD